MTRRYYCPDLPVQGGPVVLGESESQHAIRVMRLQVGDSIQLFDGVGNQSDATVIQINRRECHCRADQAVAIDREPSCELHLGIALPKPDRAKEMIERLTEMGVRSVTPIIAERTQRPPSVSLLGKLRRGVVEACKQSERNVLMRVGDPVKLPEFLSTDSAPRRLLAHPDGLAFADWIDDEAPVAAQGLIGPEGGWTDTEAADAVEAGYTKVTLGKRIYRIETAAAVVAARVLV